jgi:hypothetical protein
MSQKKTGLETDIVDTGRGEGDGCIAQQRVVGRGDSGAQAASSASRPASSSAISASMISSSALPSITSSSL